MTGGKLLNREEEDLLRGTVEHLHGPEEVDYAGDELVVVCLVRDARPYVRSFVEHYRSLGVKHLAFLDNGSVDGTVEALKGYDNVTVLRTGLSFGEHKHTLRRYLFSRFGKKDRWCLYADVDELFDYPYSEMVSLGSFLRYLSGKSYTAVVAQMLDMFPEEPLTGRTGEPEEPLKQRHRFYDVSGVRKKRMKGSPSLRDNVLESEEVEIYRGGIRDAVFGSDPLLTKFPLIFLDGRARPMEDSHRCGGARVADVTSVLLHYKFLDGYFQEHVAWAVREESYFQNSARYKMYQEALDRAPRLRLKLETARELRHVNDLLEEQFLVVSEDYLDRVGDEEKKSALRSPPDDTSGLFEACLEARRRERAKALKVQWLERRLREAGRAARRARQPERRPEAGKLKELSRENQRLSRQIGDLERQLAGVRGSRAWRLMDALHRIKVRVSERKRSS